jgi:hypothetical protein
MQVKSKTTQIESQGRETAKKLRMTRLGKKKIPKTNVRIFLG